MIVINRLNNAFRARYDGQGRLENPEDQYINFEVEGEALDVAPGNQLLILDKDNKKIAIFPNGYWYMARKVPID